MTQAIAVRREGDAFQARLFWMKALCLLDTESSIVRVGFESGPKGFDDIWVEYERGRCPNDQDGNPLLREHIQCKWHVSPGDYKHSDLICPDFINANSTSLLQRAYNAQLTYAPEGSGARFKLVTNWNIHNDDPLRSMIYQRSGTIRLDRLFGTLTDNSGAGAVRKLWREHLSIDEIKLRIFTRTLAFGLVSSSLDDMREQLDRELARVGLRRIPPQESAFLYDDLTYQWLGQGRIEFDRQKFHNACTQEGLFSKAKEYRVLYGVKSFEHPFDRLEDRCASVLDLVPHFDERSIRQQEDWQTVLYPQLKLFLYEVAKSAERVRLVLDSHISLTFAAGSIINIKSGRVVELLQRVTTSHIWAPDDTEFDPAWPNWMYDKISLTEEGAEIAVAVGLTHSINTAVKAFVEKNLPQVGLLLVAQPSCGVGSQAVLNGSHAFDLAEKLSLKIQEVGAGNRTATHLFIAGPNGFTFFLGQRQPSLGRIYLYEYDFENTKNGTYERSLSLPA